MAKLDLGGWVYDLFSQRLISGWLVGIDARSVIDLADRYVAEFRHFQPHFISIATPDPIEFIASLMAGLRIGLPIFLGNPRWGVAEWDRFAKLTARVDLKQHRQLIMIPTGGSSGELRFAMHSWETLSASVWGFQEFYEVDAINCICTLPLYHVSGLMQLWRSLLTDGKLLVSDLYQINREPTLLIDRINSADYFISLVPTQLAKLLDLNASWLVQMQTILIGGAPPSLELLARARVANLPLALTYGMTETGSQVTSLKPAEFLAGNNSCGVALPHAKIKLQAATDLAESKVEHPIAAIKIKANSLMLGYFPNLNSSDYFEPDDLGSIDKNGYLTIVGRNSSKIITGGENVFPIEVIEAVLSTRLVADAWVVGIPDRYWGQAVTMIYVASSLSVSADILAQAIAGKISSYKIPKYWIPVDTIPRNTLGKVLEREIEKIIKDFLTFDR
ncbi:AMP-binding protein [Chamaesiphon sp. GL140_3_metabinner_50]|uniref:AMP-binding protein n=1 Tax=Chamaesiphon sp. GL140_3_metabinner_50 TaxID=2970812 RepID=UPI0025E064EF|nr:AMP-binding protein [Chamaesiphon sp. GL140_3_metabinner_50]